MKAHANAAQRLLGDRNLQVWRCVAAHAQGITYATLREQLTGKVDAEPLRAAVYSLSQMRHIQFQGAGSRWGRWFINPDMIPAGEQAPPWLAAASHDAAIDAADMVKEGRRSAAPANRLPPNSVFQLAQQMQPAEASAAAKPRGPHAPQFALLSTGSLQLLVPHLIDQAGDPVLCPMPLLLTPETTRALFCWLDRLGGTALSRLAEAA